MILVCPLNRSGIWSHEGVVSGYAAHHSPVPGYAAHNSPIKKKCGAEKKPARMIILSGLSFCDKGHAPVVDKGKCPVLALGPVRGVAMANAGLSSLSKSPRLGASVSVAKKSASVGTRPTVTVDCDVWVQKGANVASPSSSSQAGLRLCPPCPRYDLCMFAELKDLTFLFLEDYVLDLLGLMDLLVSQGSLCIKSAWALGPKDIHKNLSLSLHHFVLLSQSDC